MKSFVYFSSQSAFHSRVRQYLREFIELERSSISRVKELRDQRLESLLQQAVCEVPFYRDRIDTPHPDLSDFPILTKATLRENFLSLMTRSLQLEYSGKKRKAPYSWLEVKTGGSTGVPTSVIHDREFRDRGRAARLYSQRLCGFPFGKPFFRLWGSMQEINHARTSWKTRLQSYLGNETWLNAFQMQAGDMRRYLAAINASNVEHLMAYVDAAAALARFAKKESVAVRPLKSIMACAGTVTDSSRALLQEVFRAHIHNMYGSRDCSSIACECEAGGLHYYSPHLILEVVDDDGRLLPPCQCGRLLVTLLSNRSFPIIRYEIGDVGSLADRECACGRPFPLMHSIEGRSVEFLSSTDGGYVSPVYIRHLIGVVHNSGLIRKFQLVQHSRFDFELKLELDAGFTDDRQQETQRLLDRDLTAVLGREARIRQVQVAEIPCLSSGKFLYTINHYLPTNENSVLSHSA